MEKRLIPAAVFSPDPALRSLLRSVLEDKVSEVDLALEVGVPLTEVDSETTGELRDQRVDLVALDFEEDPEMAIRFAQFLSSQRPSCRLIGVGPLLPSDQLLEAMRAGVTEYLTRPVTEDAVREALHRIMPRLSSPTPSSNEGAPSGRVVAVLGAKGGSGATTVAINVAVSLRQRTGKRVVLVDLDVEMGDIALFLGLEPRFHMLDLAKNLRRMDDGLLNSYLETHESGVQVLAAPLRPEGGEQLLPETVRKSLQFLESRFDYVVVDLARSFSPATQAVAGEADQILLVTQADMPSLRNIKRGLPILDRVLGTQDERLRLVLNRAQDQSMISPEEIERALNLKVSWRLSNDYEAVSRSVNTGEPVVSSTRESRLAEDIQNLTDSIAGIRTSANTSPRGRLRWPKLFGRPEGVSRG